MLGRKSKPTFGGEVLSAHNEPESAEPPSLHWVALIPVLERGKRMAIRDWLKEPVGENVAFRFCWNFMLSHGLVFQLSKDDSAWVMSLWETRTNVK